VIETRKRFRALLRAEWFWRDFDQARETECIMIVCFVIMKSIIEE
jgi:hypothetical protein